MGVSKQSEAKAKQNYVQSPAQRCCANCENMSFKVKEYFNGYKEMRALRCDLGGFAVKKLGVCDEFKDKG